MSSFQPSDTYPRSAARVTNSKRLALNFDDVKGYHDLELLAAIAIARVELLETRLGVDERRSRNVLYPRRSNVVPLPKRKESA